MLADKDGLYFLTAKGKAFYKRLQNQPVISITGKIGNDTLSSKSVTLRGEVREIGQGLLSEIFEKNPYMKAIYPNAASRTALTAFQIYKGNGCECCVKICPQNCIDISSCTAKIQQEHCLHCGKCMEICPSQAIERPTIKSQVEK